MRVKRHVPESDLDYVYNVARPNASGSPRRTQSDAAPLRQAHRGATVASDGTRDWRVVMSSDISRRTFVNALGPGALAAGAAAQNPPVIAPKEKQVIGIQIGSISFLDEGTEKVLDILQEKA